MDVFQYSALPFLILKSLQGGYTVLVNIRDGDSTHQTSSDLLRLPDSDRDEVLTQFTSLASELTGIPGSFISVLDEQNQIIRAKHNISVSHTPVSDAFCRYAVEECITVVVPDTLCDVRFKANPLVLRPGGIRFYAGVPLINREGVVMGTLCVTDSQPHQLPSEKIALLSRLANMVVVFLEAWQSAGFTDAVTKLPNRQQLIRHLNILASASQDKIFRLTIVDCIDMPRAYELARALGMPPVEAILKDTGQLLRDKLSLEPEQILYTVATGRFAILSHSEDPFSAETVLEVMRGVIPRLSEGVTMELTLYAGDVCFSPLLLSAQEVLRRAVSALHEAINLNEGARTFNAESDMRRNADFRLMNDLAIALKTGSGGLYLVYQPRLSLPEGCPVGLEALIRWHHPERGELSPVEFLPVVQFTGLMSELTDWVIGEAVRQLKIWFSEGVALPVSVNVGVSDLARSSFITRLEETMSSTGLPVTLLEFECLETELATENPAAMDTLARLRVGGYRISLDDFGAGYSNIGYLRRMPVDVIKLDRALISDLNSDSGSRVIASSIIRMLKSLNYVVVAEGVEVQESIEMLSTWGCDQAQGFYFSRPLLPSELSGWLLSAGDNKL